MRFVFHNFSEFISTFHKFLPKNPLELPLHFRHNKLLTLILLVTINSHILFLIQPSQTTSHSRPTIFFKSHHTQTYIRTLPYDSVFNNSRGCKNPIFLIYMVETN
jgi:hypothetical protein